MNRIQRYKYESLGRASDFGKARGELFPESSTGGKLFARVAAAVAAIDSHLKNRVLARAEARKEKDTTRRAVHEHMKRLAQAARRITRTDGDVNPFRLPRRRTLTGDLSTARAFLQAAATRQDEFQYFGLSATFMSDFAARVDELQRVSAVRRNSKTIRGEAQAGILESLADGFEAVRDLDVVVGVATSDDPVAWAAWQTARRVEGQRWKPRAAAADAAPADAEVPVAGPAAAPASAATPAVTSPVAAALPVMSPAAASPSPVTLGKAS